MSSGSTSIHHTEYPGTHAYLQLILNRMESKDDYNKVLIYLSQLKDYIITHDANTMKLETLRNRFISVMKEANRIKEVLEADQPVKAADLAFRAEILTLLGQLKLRDDEAEAKRNRNRWFAGALLTVGAAIVGPVLAVGALNLIGFSSVCPVAGSMAAGIQSAVYGGSVTSSSAFAFCQRAAMGGIMVGSAAGIAAGVATLGGGTALLGGLGGAG
ncbi:hypothetical protein FRC04_012118 [Tulasnella sp. 424]|nr:hypothetical protein FRC04_012118 [Tulasnella sp. 424]